MRAYGVVLCPKCRKAKVFEQGRKTTGCAVCGNRLNLERLIVRHRTEDVEDARRAAGLLNARLAGREDEYVDAMLDFDTPQAAAPAPRTPVERAARAARAVRGEDAKAEAVARTLESFTRAEFEDALGRAGVPAERAEALLARLAARSYVYAPSVGAYRVV